MTPTGGVFPVAWLDKPCGARRARPCLSQHSRFGRGRVIRRGHPRTDPGQAVGLPALGRQADDAIWIRSPLRWAVRATYFSERLEKSIVPNAVIFTPVTLLDQPNVAVEYHIGMAGMSLASSASAAWYLALA